jgi:hypothetical protein
MPCRRHHHQLEQDHGQQPSRRSVSTRNHQALVRAVVVTITKTSEADVALTVSVGGILKAVP